MILEKIKPTKEETLELQKEAKLFTGELTKRLKLAKAVVGGSVKKNTFLKGTKEIDIFIKFDYKTYKVQSNKLSDYLAKVLPKALRIHGSRDYFQIEKNGVLFEVVPVLDIKSAKQAINVTDISPLHTNYVTKHLSEKQANEVRVLKQFCKSNNLYGAESYIQGFSGYVLEILIVHYKTFQNVLKQVSNWPDKVVLDTTKAFKSKQDVLFSLNSSKTYSPLVLLDPVQPERNIAAALSKEKFDLLRKIAKDYLKKPNQSYFEEKKFAPKDGSIIFRVIPLEGKRDVVGSQLMKAFTFLKEEAEREGFRFKEASWYWEKECYFSFLPKIAKLPETKKHLGPLLKEEVHVKIFKKKWKQVKIEKNRVIAMIPRKHPEINQFLNA